MIEIYNNKDTLLMTDGQTYTPEALAASDKYRLMTQYKSVIWKADDSGYVYRWRFFDAVINLLSDDEMTLYQNGTLTDDDILPIIAERFTYTPPTPDELSDAMIELADTTSQDITDIMDAIIELTNVPA